MRKLATALGATALAAGLIFTNAPAASAAGSTPPPVAKGAKCYQSWKPHWYSSWDEKWLLDTDVKYSKCVYWQPSTWREVTVKKFDAGL